MKALNVLKKPCHFHMHKKNFLEPGQLYPIEDNLESFI